MQIFGPYTCLDLIAKINMASKDMVVLKLDGTDILDDVVRNVRDTPLVFRCTSCGTIVGDSTDWITASEKLRAITLVRVTSKVQCGRALLSSANGEDMGSAYHVLKCEQCTAEFGKMYKTTPSHLDDFRNRFTFNIDKIDSYQIGCAEQGINVTGDDLLTMADTILSKIDKLQFTLTSLEARVSALENTRQSKTMSKDESNVAENDNTDVPANVSSMNSTANVNSLKNSPANVNSLRNSLTLEANRADSSSLKRRSQAAGLYVSSSPQTLKRSKVHK